MLRSGEVGLETASWAKSGRSGSVGSMKRSTTAEPWYSPVTRSRPVTHSSGGVERAFFKGGPGRGCGR